MPRHDRHTAGFTLLEFLICLVLASLLIGLLVQAQGFVFRAWRGGDAQVLAQRRLNHCLDVMLGQLGSAAPFRAPGLAGRGLAFDGDGRQVLFTTSQAVGGGGLAGLWYVQYRLAGDGDAMRLESRQWPAGRGVWRELSAEWAVATVLLDGLSEARFSFQGRLPGGGVRWRGQWSGRQGELPLAVRLEFVKDGWRRDWQAPLMCGGRRHD